MFCDWKPQTSAFYFELERFTDNVSDIVSPTLGLSGGTPIERI
ncbi:hypothetical protein [Sporofaciens musculi]|nr:hypothetical protein [Sporofaciens musculi]